MKKAIVLLFLSTAVFLPSATEAFTLHSPSLFDNSKISCSLTNVGRISLVFVINFYDPSGVNVGSSSPARLPPGSMREAGTSYAGTHAVRCSFNVRATDPRKTATRDMVRAAVTFKDDSGAGFSFEVK